MFFRRNTAPITWIAAFLGNPGIRYENTRHNAGFMTADIIANELNVKINRAKFSSWTVIVKIGGQQVLLLKPQTYMNLSGNAVKQAMKYYKLPLDNVVVISDDVSLPTGKLRVRRRGSSGGHNGLRDIIMKCGGESFPRIRIGVGTPPHENYEMADWVLSKLNDTDKALITDASKRAAAALEITITKGAEYAMAEFN